MKNTQRIASLSLFLLLTVLLSGCSPEVGSEAWCQEMKAKPKGDWSVNEAGDFAKHCILN